MLFRHFVDEISRRDGIKFGGITAEAMDVLRSYRWPGNIRELRNIAESMLVLQKGKRIEAEQVRAALQEHEPITDERSLPVPIGKSVEQAERELILRALLDIKQNLIDLRSVLMQQGQVRPGSGRDGGSVGSAAAGDASSLSLEQMERRLIVEALERYRGNRRVAARTLKISERTLYRKIKEYGLG